MFREEVQCLSSLLEVVDLCPMFISLAFLSFDAVLDVNDEGNSFSLCLLNTPPKTVP